MDHTTSSKRCRRRLCKRKLVRSEGPDSSQCDPAQKPPVKRSGASAQQEVNARLCWHGHVPFHTHHKDGVLICDDFLAGHCLLGEECQQHHTPRPYHWQLRQTHTRDWVNVSELGQKHLEALFCNPDKTDITLSCENAGGQGDLVQRQHSAFSKLDLNTLIPQNNWSYNKVRRLATTSNTDLNPHFLTKWNLYWQELGKWKLYKEPVVSQLEAAFEKGMWNQAFMLDGNLYNVDLKKYTQCNIKTNFIREVRRRPQLISDTELWPLIKTLPLEESKKQPVVSGPDPLKPSKRRLPPTWVPGHPRKEIFAQIPVLKSGVAFACIHSLFHSSLSKSEAIILDIYQIQNMHQWTKYTIQLLLAPDQGMTALPVVGPRLPGLPPQSQTSLPPQSNPGSSQPPQGVLREIPPAILCKIGQETVQDIVSRSMEIFHLMRATQLPNGVTQSHAVYQDRFHKLQEHLRQLALLFRKLRLLFEKCAETTAELGEMPSELIPYLGEEAHGFQVDPCGFTSQWERQEVFKLPNGVTQSHAVYQDRFHKLQEHLRQLALLFRKLRLLYEKCAETTAELSEMPSELIPYLGEEAHGFQVDPCGFTSQWERQEVFKLCLPAGESEAEEPGDEAADGPNAQPAVGRERHADPEEVTPPCPCERHADPEEVTPPCPCERHADPEEVTPPCPCERHADPEEVTPPCPCERHADPEEVTPPCPCERHADPEEVTPPCPCERHADPEEVTPPCPCERHADPEEVTPPCPCERHADPEEVTPPCPCERHADPEEVTPPCPCERHADPEEVTPPCPCPEEAWVCSAHQGPGNPLIYFKIPLISGILSFRDPHCVSMHCLLPVLHYHLPEC
ncbi:UNVERIFIED_CONTAM: hypothetical protein FKN15_011896 [Acipenser sinensis]